MISINAYDKALLLNSHHNCACSDRCEIAPSAFLGTRSNKYLNSLSAAGPHPTFFTCCVPTAALALANNTAIPNDAGSAELPSCNNDPIPTPPRAAPD